MAYLPLSTANLPDPVIDPAQDVEPRDYFETFLYTGNGAGLQVGDVIKKPADTTTISSSLVFNGSSEYLSHTTSGTSSGQDQITVSFWIKNWKLDTSTFNHIWSALQGGSDLCFYMALTTTHTIRFYFDETPSGSVGPTYFDTPMAFTDTSRWYHVHLKVDLNQSTTAEKYQVWVDGVQQTFSYTVQGGVQETNVDLFQNGTTHNIGRYIGNSSQHLGMYLAELHAVDGTAHDPTDFGNFDANGIWIPKTVTGITYGTNGFYLDFSDNSSTTTLGADSSGNNNDWTLNNFATTDQVADSPTDNFPVINASNSVDMTLTEGNLNSAATGTQAHKSAIATQRLPKSGKFYWEVTLNSSATNGTNAVGIASASYANNVALSGAGNYFYGEGLAIYGANGSAQGPTTYGTFDTSGTATTFTANNVIGVAYDADNKTIKWYKNGVEMDYNVTFFNDVDYDFIPAASAYNNPVGAGNNFNFGQKTFAYTPPTGYLALSENNITVDDQNLESPDLVWIKSRGAARHHGIWDSVRGAGKLLQSSSTDAETDRPYGVLEFNTNGFTLGPEDPSWHYNEPGIDEVAWGWKAGTSFSNGVGENGATIASSGKFSTESGFSIASFNSGSAGTQSFKHGLSQVPEIVFLKSRTTSQAWPVWTSLTGNPSTAYGYLNYTNAFSTDASQWSNTAPTSTLFTFNSNYALNQNADCIAYCFHSVEGFSKLGSYTGNGSTDGPFVYTGFQPAFVLFKKTNITTASWAIRDNTRYTYNPTRNTLYADKPDAEYTGTAHDVDFLSNGFKPRTTDGLFNSSGATYIYMAFAENPFKYSNAR